MTLAKASVVCQKKGMRLPTRYELIGAFANGTRWQGTYWSSSVSEMSGDYAFFLDMRTGNVGSIYLGNPNETRTLQRVRCVAGPTLPHLPVEVRIRNSLMGRGYVAEFQNTSDKHITVMVKLENFTTNEKWDRTLTIPAFKVVKLGWLEGWQFVSGERITVTLAGHEIRIWQVP